MNRSVVGAACTFAGVASGLFALVLGAAETPPPHLLLGPADFERIRTTARTEPWAKEVVGDLEKTSAEWPAAHLREYGLAAWAPPAEGGGWGGHYICPDHGVGLTFTPGHNVCPVCRKDYHGWPWDYVIFSRRHLANARAVRDLGLAYRLSGDATHAAKARAILAAYATLYPTLPIRSHKEWPVAGSHSGGRVTSQTLNESDWVLAMAFGYDLIRETMSPAERAAAERDVLRSASDVIARRVRSLGNWTTRHNAAHLAVGLVLGDPALVDLALNAEFGFRDQLRRGITAEGPWHEGSWGYHFYALGPLLQTREMAARAGLAMPEADRLRLSLDAPIACVLPDGTLPNFNDSGFTSLRGYALNYDIGYRLFGDRRYLRIVREAERGLDALLWGAAAVGEGVLPELQSNVLPQAGFATLRAAGSDHTVAVKFGAHGGGHGHNDKLNFVSYASGRMQAVDPGTQSYAFKTHHTWDKVTVSHNTLVVDETTQAEATGRLLEWHPGGIATAIRVDAGPVYPQATLERLLVHTAGYTLDVSDVRASDGAAHRFDWVYHNAGKVSSPLALAPYAAFPAKSGYEHLADPRAVVTAEDWEATFMQQGTGLRLWMLGTAGTTVVLGTGLGQDLSVPVPFAMARRTGTVARFVTVLEPYRDVPRVRRVWWARPDVIAVESAAGVDEIAVAPGRFAFTRVPSTATVPVPPTPRHATKVVVVNDDGFSAFFNGSYKSVADVRRRIQGYRDTPVAVLEWCVTGGSRVNFPSKVTELIGAGLTEYPRRGDKQVYDTLRQIADRGVNLTQAVAEACHEAGLQCYASMRMNGDYARSADGDLNQRQFNSAFWWQHPDQRVRGPKGEDKTKLSYAFADVRAFKLGILREVAATQGLDGVNLDFLRHPPFFGFDEPLLRAFQEKFGEDARTVKPDDRRWLDLRCEVMTGFVRSVRELLDEAGAKRGRRLGFSVRVDWREYRAWGCDLERWVRAGWLDYVVLAQHTLGGYEFDLKPFVAIAAGTGCAVYFGEEAVLSGHDLTAKEDRLIAEGKLARPRRDRLSPEQYRTRAAKWYSMGADGVHLFNTYAGEDIRAAAGLPAK